MLGGTEQPVVKTCCLQPIIKNWLMWVVLLVGLLMQWCWALVPRTADDIFTLSTSCLGASHPCLRDGA